MRVYDDICDMLNRELEQIVQKKELTSNSLDIMGKAVDIVKDLSIVKAMEESGYSERYPYYMYGDDGYAMDNSYARGRKRDSMGRYSRDEYPHEGYSRDNHTMNKLQEMLDNAKTEEERSMIRKWMEQAM